MSSSLTNDLRKYRFKSNKQSNGDVSVSSTSDNGNSSSKLIVKDSMAAGRKRIRAINDSSDEESNDTKTTTTTNGEADSTTLSIAEKERRLIYLKSKFESVETMKLQDALFLVNWNVEEAIKIMNSEDFQHERKRVALLQTKIANSPIKMASTTSTNGNGSANSSKWSKMTKVKVSIFLRVCVCLLYVSFGV